MLLERRELTECLGSCYNRADIDTGAQNPNLRLQPLKMYIATRSKPLQDKSQERERQVVHIDSFRSAKRARRPENAWYYTADRFWYPQGRTITAQDASRAGGERPRRFEERKSTPSSSARLLLKLLLKNRRTWSTWNTWTGSGQGTYPKRPS